MSLAGKAVVSIWHDILDSGRDEFYWWHLHEHMPERVGVPGFRRGRRYIAEEGTPEFFTLYEAESLSVLSGKDYLARLNDPTPWTLEAVKYFDNVARSIQEVVYTAGPGMGGFLLTVRFEQSSSEGFIKQLVDDVLKPATDLKGIAGAHLCKTDLGISDTKTAERDKREGGTEMPGWALLFETARHDELHKVRNTWLNPGRLSELGIADTAQFTVYRLEFIRTQSDTVG